MIDLRVVVHDFVGHAFQVQLSRALAARGHSVLHLYCPEFETPKGRLTLAGADSNRLLIEPVRIGRPYRKYSPAQRLMADLRYARACARRINAFGAQVVLSGNATPFLQQRLRSSCQRRGIKFVSWVQDLYGEALHAFLRRKFGFLGNMVGHRLWLLDASLVQKSDGVVFISEDFRRAFDTVKPRCSGPWRTIENWAPLEDLPLRPKVNPWSCKNRLNDKKVYLYSGTLGLKHNPELIVRLAAHFGSNPDVAVVVASQGLGRTYLEGRKRELNLSNLLLFDFQPFDELPNVIASADVLLALVEESAGRFSVPSKVLTYMCAGRPLLLSVPSSNLAARITEEYGAGVVVPPGDFEGFIRSAQWLLDQPRAAAELAENARRYAEQNFDIDKIAAKFEAAFQDALSFQLAK